MKAFVLNPNLIVRYDVEHRGWRLSGFSDFDVVFTRSQLRRLMRFDFDVPTVAATRPERRLADELASLGILAPADFAAGRSVQVSPRSLCSNTRLGNGRVLYWSSKSLAVKSGTGTSARVVIHRIARPRSLTQRQLRSLPADLAPRQYSRSRRGRLELVTLQYVDAERLDMLPQVRLAKIAPSVLGMRLVEAAVRLHALGIAHGDLHPGNVLVDRRGGILLIDFELATHKRAKGRSASLISGAPEFAAPEVLAHRSVSQKSDVYALGSMLRFIYALYEREMPSPMAVLVRSARLRDPRARPKASTLLARLAECVDEP